MPIYLPEAHPVCARLKSEGVRFVSSAFSPSLRIGILNLMPEKEETEYHLLSHLGHFPLSWEPVFLMTASYRPTHCPKEHLDRFYTTWPALLSSDQPTLDGLIVTGAPVELLPFEEVIYLDELKSMLLWADRNVPGGTLHICWAAQAGLYLRHGIGKVTFPEKLSGLFCHHRSPESRPILSGMDDCLYLPHSRYTGLDENALGIPGLPLHILLQSPQAGSVLIQSHDGLQTYLTGHPEYDRLRLDREYRRDLSRGRQVPLPRHYYPEDDPQQQPAWTWRANARLLYLNWMTQVHEASVCAQTRSGLS